MSLSLERAVSILPLGEYPPSGVPIGTHAFVLKMTPEALQELANQLAAHQPAETTTSAIGTAPGSSQSTKPGQGRQSLESTKKNEKPLMQLVVSDSGQPQFIIGANTFRADATTEPSTTEIYARHQSPLSDSDQPSSEAGSTNPLQMVAKVDGRLRVMRDFTSVVQQSVSERTAKLNKEAQPRSAIVLDAPVPNASSSSKAGARAQQNKSAPTAKSAIPSGTAGAVRPPEQRVQVFTPPKSDGSPSSATSASRGPKHPIPETFGSLDLSIPNRWDGPISIPIRIIHWVALKAKKKDEILSEAVSESEKEKGQKAIDILCETKEDGTIALRDEAFYYLRPWAWVNYTPTNRTEIAKFARIALRRFGYDDRDEAWENLRKPVGWVDPWRNTPEGILHYREKEQRRATSVIPSKEEHEKLKAEAKLAPTLTSTIKPGFFSSKPAPTTAKAKKGSKEKEPKVKKTSAGSEQEAGAQPRIAHSTSQSSTTRSATPSSSTPTVEPTVYESELRVRQSGPGSKAGKMAIAKRIQREKEEGFASTVSTPSRSPLPLSQSETRKRKTQDDDYEDVGKRKKTHALPPKPSTETLGGPSSKKRKGDNIDALSPPTKMRKSELPSAPVQSASTSTKKTSATRDYTSKKTAAREGWDYSSEEGEDRSSSKRGATATHRSVHSLKKDEAKLKPLSSSSSRRAETPTPHRMPPPMTYLGCKAVYMQKWSDYSMVLSIIMGEEAKLESVRVGDDSNALMSTEELRGYIKKRTALEVELKELKLEIARRAPKPSAASSTA